MRKKPIPEAMPREPLKRTRFHCTPGVSPAGYQCGTITIMRTRGETTEELRLRCKASVVWLNVDDIMVFVPL